MDRKPLEANEIVVHVPKGSAQHVRVQEVEATSAPAEITVQVSKKRVATARPVLGVIVK